MSQPDQPGVPVSPGPHHTTPAVNGEQDKGIVTASASTPPTPTLNVPCQPQTAPLPLSPPTTFGRYELRQLLGRGGMGVVYLAHDSQLNRPVALKLPTLEDEGKGHAAERFLREARATAVLRHANICPIHDAGIIDGRLYLSMAYIEG